MFEVVGVKSGIVKNENSRNKGKGYQFLHILYDDKYWTGKTGREIFIFDDVNEVGRPIMVGDVIVLHFDINGRIQKVSLA